MACPSLTVLAHPDKWFKAFMSMNTEGPEVSFGTFTEFCRKAERDREEEKAQRKQYREETQKRIAANKERIIEEEEEKERMEVARRRGAFVGIAAEPASPHVQSKSPWSAGGVKARPMSAATARSPSRSSLSRPSTAASKRPGTASSSRPGTAGTARRGMGQSASAGVLGAGAGAGGYSQGALVRGRVHDDDDDDDDDDDGIMLGVRTSASAGTLGGSSPSGGAGKRGGSRGRGRGARGTGGAGGGGAGQRPEKQPFPGTAGKEVLLAWLRDELKRKRVGSAQLMGLMDDNRSGTASFNEFANGLTAANFDLKRDECMRLFKAVDGKGGDMSVSLEELKTLLYATAGRGGGGGERSSRVTSRIQVAKARPTSAAAGRTPVQKGGAKGRAASRARPASASATDRRVRPNSAAAIRKARTRPATANPSPSFSIADRLAMRDADVTYASLHGGNMSIVNRSMVYSGSKTHLHTIDTHGHVYGESFVPRSRPISAHKAMQLRGQKGRAKSAGMERPGESSMPGGGRLARHKEALEKAAGLKAGSKPRPHTAHATPTGPSSASGTGTSRERGGKHAQNTRATSSTSKRRPYTAGQVPPRSGTRDFVHARDKKKRASSAPPRRIAVAKVTVHGAVHTVKVPEEDPNCPEQLCAMATVSTLRKRVVRNGKRAVWNKQDTTWKHEHVDVVECPHCVQRKKADEENVRRRKVAAFEKAVADSDANIFSKGDATVVRSNTKAMSGAQCQKGLSKFEIEKTKRLSRRDESLLWMHNHPRLGENPMVHVTIRRLWFMMLRRYEGENEETVEAPRTPRSRHQEPQEVDDIDEDDRFNVTSLFSVEEAAAREERDDSSDRRGGGRHGRGGRDSRDPHLNPTVVTPWRLEHDANSDSEAGTGRRSVSAPNTRILSSSSSASSVGDLNASDPRNIAAQAYNDAQDAAERLMLDAEEAARLEALPPPIHHDVWLTREQFISVLNQAELCHTRTDLVHFQRVFSAFDPEAQVRRKGGTGVGG